jgi:formylglycine-generating enzyme required for sulfatase activity
MVSVFQQQRSAKEDIILLRNGDVMRGQVLNETLGMSNSYGEIAVPLRRCAGVSFEQPPANEEVLVTVNYNRVTGILKDREIRFRPHDSDAEIDIRKQRIRSMILMQTPGELEFLDPDDQPALVKMANGDFLTGHVAEPYLAIQAGSPEVTVSLSDIRRVAILSGSGGKATIEKKDLGTVEGKLTAEEVTIDLDVGARLEGLYRDDLAEIVLVDAKAHAAAEFGVVLPVQLNAESTVLPGTAEAVVTNSLGMKLKLILPGSFLMGSEKGEDNEKPVHKVTITKPFYIGMYEVTQSQWEQVMGTNIHEQRDLADPNYTVRGEGPNFPMYHVSWLEAMDFCRKLSEKEGVEYRLPTEAEWEYACRAGSQTEYFWGDRIDDRYFWYEENSGKVTQPVGTRMPNLWGLYDMSGNVWEWCEDCYSPSYPQEHQFDPVGPPTGDLRVFRGGYCTLEAKFCRSARREGFNQAGRSRSVGFRIARNP